MNVLVTGGRGVLGRRVVARLQASGHAARVAGRSGPVVLDLATGVGLEAAVQGVEAVVHCASHPSARDTRVVEVEGSARLARAAREAGVGHLAYISIVGVDRVPLPYYRHKLHAERVIEDSGTPFSVLRATQFFPFVERLLLAAPVMIAPRGFRAQPVDVDAVAARLVRAVDEGPGGRLTDLGGPEVREVADLARALRAARGLRRPVVRPWLPGAVVRAVRAGGLTCPDGDRAGPTWEEWLQASGRG